MTYLTTHPIMVRETFVRRLVAQIKAYSQHRKDKRDYKRLMTMSNRHLNDIGVTRDEVRSAYNRPMVRISFH